jgi:hypothetical protein
LEGLSRERYSPRQGERLRQPGEHHKVGVKLDTCQAAKTTASVFPQYPDSTASSGSSECGSEWHLSTESSTSKRKQALARGSLSRFPSLRGLHDVRRRAGLTLT